jgi:hypothetical protein
MKGGSVSSENVVADVKVEAFDKLDGLFTNIIGGAKRSKGPRKVKSTTKTSKKTESTKSRKTVAKSEKPVAKSVKPRKTDKASKTRKPIQRSKKGGMCPMCGGNSMLHMNQYDNSGIFNLYNKKGGAEQPLLDVGYNYNIPNQSTPNGPIVTRTLDTSAIDILASEPASQMGNLVKTLQYGQAGSAFEGPNVPFQYAQTLTGGKKTKKVVVKKSTSARKSKK